MHSASLSFTQYDHLVEATFTCQYRVKEVDEPLSHFQSGWQPQKYSNVSSSAGVTAPRSEPEDICRVCDEVKPHLNVRQEANGATAHGGTWGESLKEWRAAAKHYREVTRDCAADLGLLCEGDQHLLRFRTAERQIRQLRDAADEMKSRLLSAYTVAATREGGKIVSRESSDEVRGTLLCVIEAGHVIRGLAGEIEEAFEDGWPRETWIDAARDLLVLASHQRELLVSARCEKGYSSCLYG
jgi:hypothetical protein